MLINVMAKKVLECTECNMLGLIDMLENCSINLSRINRIVLGLSF